MGKKGCELCSNPARMFCDSDQASLCWDCDEKVHAANFLVAKHSRTLLCHVCHSPTPWTAAGPKLGPTVSVCHACAHPSSRPETEDGYDSQESESDDDDDGEYYSDSDDFSEEEEEEDDDEEEEDGENQVVPWSTSASNSPPPPPPTAATSSSSEENVSFSSSKRTRNNPFESEDEDGCCSSQNLDSGLGASELSFQESDDNCNSSLSFLRPLMKMRRRSNDGALIPSEQAAVGQSRVKPSSSSGTAAIVEKLRRFEQEIVTEEGDPSAVILGLCKLTRD